MPRLDLNKILVETTITKVLKDLKSDPKKTLRNWVDKSGGRSKGKVQQVLVGQIKTMLQDKTSAYYTLVESMINNIQVEILKTFGMNFGYYGCTLGAQKSRSQELIYNVHIPWNISFDMDGKVSVSHVDTIIEQGKKLGIYVYQLHCRSEKAIYDLVKLFEKHKDCAFIVFIQPEVVSEHLIAEYGVFYNFMLAVACHEQKADEKLAMLRHAGFLYAVNYEYDVSNVQTILSGAYYEYAANMGAVFALLWPKESVDNVLRERVYQHVICNRMEQRQPVVAIDMINDILQIDQLLSEKSSLLMFNERGQRISMKDAYKKETENLFKQPFIQILKGL